MSSGLQTGRMGKHNFVDSSSIMSPKNAQLTSSPAATHRVQPSQLDPDYIPAENATSRVSKYQMRQFNQRLAQVVESKIEQTRAERSHLLRQEHNVRGNKLPQTVIQGLAKAAEQSRQKTPIMSPKRSINGSDDGKGWNYRVTAKEANKPFNAYEEDTNNKWKRIVARKKNKYENVESRISPMRSNTIKPRRDQSPSPSQVPDNSGRPNMIAKENTYNRTMTPVKGRSSTQIQILESDPPTEISGVNEFRQTVQVPKDYMPTQEGLKRFFTKKASVDNQNTFVSSEVDVSHRL